MTLGGEAKFSPHSYRTIFRNVTSMSAKYFAGAVQHRHQLSDKHTNFTNNFYVPLTK